MNVADCAGANEGDVVSNNHRDIPKWEKQLVCLLVAWFILRLLFLAMSISPAIPPDEATHVERAQIYSAVLLIPENGHTTLASGLVNHIPYLYYWLMGRVINLNPLPDLQLFVLRLSNALMGLLTILYGYRFMLRLTRSPIVRVLFVVFLTNTIMFTGLAASVNYDNLVNLLAAIAIYRLFVFFDEPRPKHLAILMLLLLAGALTKEAFLPLALLLTVAAVFHERRRWPAILRELLASLRHPTLRLGSLYTAVLLALALNFGLYGGNLLKFGKLAPTFDQVVGVENALEYRIFARNYILNEFRSGRLRFDEAMQMTNLIRHNVDRDATRWLLQIARNPDPDLMGPITYSGAWSLRLSQLLVSYAGHRVAVKTIFEWVPYLAIFLVSTLIMLWKWPELSQDGVGYAVFIVVGYLLVVLWLVNYPIYRKSYAFPLALTARYLYPVWVPFCGLLAHCLLYPTSARVRIGLAILAASVFLYGDLPAFLLATDSTWFSPRHGLPPIWWGG